MSIFKAFGEEINYKDIIEVDGAFSVTHMNYGKSPLFNKVIDYYSTYQNSYVKHNDFVKLNEMEFIISQTNSMIKFLVENFK